MTRPPQVVAVGRYEPALDDYLAQARSRYRGVKPGTMVMAVLFDGPSSEHDPDGLATALGTSMWDFSTHLLDPYAVDESLLDRRFDDPFGNHLEAFCRLRDAGFHFFFDPGSNT